MIRSRCAAVLLAACCLTLTACSPGGIPGPSPSTPASSPATPAVDLTRPGEARAVIAQLSGRSGTQQAIRVTITRWEATLTYVEKDKARTLQWRQGEISEMDSDVAWIQQAQFTPAEFALDDVGALFDRAAAVSSSAETQELQINEYNEGRVLMTVTTTPESSTVFFRADGSLINTLDFTTTSGVTEALADLTDSSTALLGLGYSPDLGMWVDVVARPGVVERRIRPAKLPPYHAERNASTTMDTFEPSVIRPEVIATQLLLASLVPGQSQRAEVTFVMDRRDGEASPVLRFTVQGSTTLRDLDGNDITERLER